jgi:chorismate mutase/prephenate dehydratase
VVPVENSTEGVVARSLDLFLHTPLFIIGETSLFVRHNLLRKDDSLEGIRPSWRTRRRWRSATSG